MSERTEGETNEQLIAMAAEYEYSVSKRQLAEWHRAGLLPAPQQVFGSHTGSASLYPIGTGDRLLALCTIRKQSRRNADVAWGLWMTGYDVPEAYIRGPLEREATFWREGVDKLRRLLEQSESTEEELADAFLDFLDQTASARSFRKVIMQARKRVGRNGFPTFVRIFIEVVCGSFKGYRVDPVTGTSDEERDIVEKGLGVTRARTDRLADAGPWLSGDTGEILATLSQLVYRYPPGYELEKASLAALEQVRDEVKLFMNFFTSWGAIAEQMFGRGAFGLSGFVTLANDQRPGDQAMWILLWRTLRAADLSDTFNMMLPLAAQWQQTVQPQFAALAQLREEVPAAAELLDPKTIARAMRSKRQGEKHLQALRAMRDERADELDAFFAARPEVKTLARESEEPDSEHERATLREPKPESKPSKGRGVRRERP